MGRDELPIFEVRRRGPFVSLQFVFVCRCLVAGLFWDRLDGVALVGWVGRSSILRIGYTNCIFSSSVLPLTDGGDIPMFVIFP